MFHLGLFVEMELFSVHFRSNITVSYFHNLVLANFFLILDLTKLVFSLQKESPKNVSTLTIELKKKKNTKKIMKIELDGILKVANGNFRNGNSITDHTI